jgi:hypothetical protein
MIAKFLTNLVLKKHKLHLKHSSSSISFQICLCYIIPMLNVGNVLFIFSTNFAKIAPCVHVLNTTRSAAVFQFNAKSLILSPKYSRMIAKFLTNLVLKKHKLHLKHSSSSISFQICLCYIIPMLNVGICRCKDYFFYKFR